MTDLGLDTLSKLTVFSKYAKYNPQLKRRETWEEIVDRYEIMLSTKYPSLKEEIKKNVKFIKEKKVLPSMRALQFAGIAMEVNNARGYNCFGRETEFITSEGLKSFNDFSHGDEVVVLTHLGNWKKAVVKNFGEQKLNKIQIKRGNHQHYVRATPNHRWILKDNTETTTLKVKDKLAASTPIFDEFDYFESTPIERLYWAYGYIFGDGTCTKNKNGELKASMVRLCGKDKSLFLERFEELGFSTSSSNSLNGDIIVYTGKYFKEAPNPEKDNPSLIRAFVAGYLDADGGKNNSQTSLSKFRKIVATGEKHKYVVEKLFPIAGVFVSSERNISGNTTNFGVRGDSKEYNISTNLSSSTNMSFVVSEIIEDTIEEVWCLEVEDDKSFVLKHGEVTGNCCFLPVDSYHAFSEAMFLLLGGTGVGYSVQFHHVEKLPAIKKPLKSRHYLIEDSIMGWADAIKMLMKAYLKEGSLPKFDFRAIREKGARLVTAGGKAPGPEPLKECLFQVQKILDRKQDGEKLSPLECHDIMCHIANSVLAGGIRRSAMISLFSHNDEEMITCKYGNWWELNEQRGRANNSAVLKRGEIEKEEFDSLWKRIEASGSGEPGIYWTNDLDWGTNPSLRAGTKVLTTKGIFPIEQLENKEFKIKNLNGEISKARCWLSGKNKQLWKITLQGGKSYYATPEHEWPIWDGEKYIKVKTPDIASGDKLPILRENSLFDGKKGTLDEGFLVGWMIGDGWKTTRKDYSEYGMIVSLKDEKSQICSKLENTLRSITPSFSGTFHKRYKSVFGQDEEEMQIILEDAGNFEISINNKEFDKQFKEKFGEVHKLVGLPKFVFEEASEEFRKGLIDGLFSSDGHVEKNKKRLVYTSKYLKLVEDLQELLGFYGIKSNIKKSISTLKNKSFERYDLRITEGASIKHFKSLFTLTNKYKQEMLDLYEFRYNIHDSKQIEVISVELSNIIEDVWDISVFDNTHCFQLSNCITGNCCEIALRPFQFCNLAEINVSDIKTQKDLNERVEIASFFGSLQAGFTEFHYLRPIWKKTTEKDALLGIGMTGIGSGEILKYNLEEATQYAISKNREVSEKIEINPAARVTCIKPSGTTSLVLGTASGIHAWHNDYYLRTMRFGKNEDVAAYLMINHPELCEDDVLRPNDTVCVRIPVKAPEGSIFRTETAIDTLERVKKFSQEWIKPGHINGANTHNVSATISIDKNRKYIYVPVNPENPDIEHLEEVFDCDDIEDKRDEWQAVGEWMWDNKNVYNGLSVLPYFGGSYLQAPFSDITKDEYDERIKSLKSLDLTKVIEMDDHVDFGQVAACAGGSCSLE